MSLRLLKNPLYRFNVLYYGIVKMYRLLQWLQLQVAAPPISKDVQQILQQKFVSMFTDLSTVQPLIEKGIVSANIKQEGIVTIPSGLLFAHMIHFSLM